MMKRILVTGATGNIGTEVVRCALEQNADSEVVAAVRSIGKARSAFPINRRLSFRRFDFENAATFSEAFDGIDVLFLLRPPHISDVERYFKPLLNAAKEAGIGGVVFLSVQGAEKSQVIPHNKIERLIRSHGFHFIFVRPSYFMQNLTTTLLPEILEKRTITLPSGKARFNWVDVQNIGEASAVLIHAFDHYTNEAIEITGTENMHFGQVSDLISQITGVQIHYRSVNPIRFYFMKTKAGVSGGLATVMTILHFLPRFQSAPRISGAYQKLTGNEPTTLKDFIAREREQFIASPHSG